MSYIISIFIGYILGSFPTAYILLKKSRNIDITKEGSGNVGAYNSYDVTKSKIVGLVVLIIDFLKGFISVLIVSFLFKDDFALQAISLLAAIFSHCYSPWIKFSGGRGLATAAGGSALIFPFLAVVWMILWLIFYLMKKDISLANISSTILTQFVTLSTLDIALKYAYPQPDSASFLALFTLAGLNIILIKHFEPLKEIISNFKAKGIKKNDIP